MALSKPPQCIGCAFEHKGAGYVPGEGPADAKICLIGKCPGRDEVAAGRPFIGSTGRRLDIELSKAGIPRRLCWLDNGVRCRILQRSNEIAPQKAIGECYRRHWHADLLKRVEQGAWVVTLGADAGKFLVGSWVGERAAGSLLEIELP